MELVRLASVGFTALLLATLLALFCTFVSGHPQLLAIIVAVSHILVRDRHWHPRDVDMISGRSNGHVNSSTSLSYVLADH